MMGKIESGEVALHARDYFRVLRNRWPAAALCFALVFLTALVITYMMPEKFTGEVLVEIGQPRPGGSTVVGKGADPGAPLASARFVENQFDIISSKAVLGKVADTLDLPGRWGLGGREEAVLALEGMVAAEARRSTDMIDIAVRHGDPATAAELANAVADAYRERRRELFADRLAEVEAALGAQERVQEEKVAAAHRRFIEAAELLGISNIDPLYSRNGVADETGGLQGLLEKMQADVFAAETELRTAGSKVTTIAGLEGDSLIRMAAPMGLGDPEFAARHGQYKELQLEAIALRKAGLGERHPQREAVAEQLVAVRGFLLESAEELKAGLEQNLEIARLAHSELEAMYRKLQDSSQGARRTNRQFIAAARDYGIQLDTLRDLKLTIERQRIDRALDPVICQIHERAEVDLRPTSPNVRLNLVLGAVLGTLFGVGLAFFLEYLDTSVKGVDELEAGLGAPVLAVVPKEVAMLHEAGPAHPDAEAYRILRTNIEFARGEAGGNVITFVSGGAGEGKSTTLMNLATVCAAAGYSVLIVDSDLRRPRLHHMFGARNSVGLTNYLTSDLPIEDVVLRTPLENLYFVPSGVLPADAAGVLNSRRFPELLAEVRSRFDLVLIDSPPILGVSDASVLASEADMTVVVVQHGKLPRHILGKVRSAIDKAGGELLGAVLNNVDLRSDSDYQYYTSYYTYHGPSAGAEVAKAGRASVVRGEGVDAF